MNDIPSPWDLEPPEEPEVQELPEGHGVVDRGIALGLIGMLVLTMLIAAGSLAVYAYFARTLPSPQ